MHDEEHSELDAQTPSDEEEHSESDAQTPIDDEEHSELDAQTPIDQEILRVERKIQLVKKEGQLNKLKRKLYFEKIDDYIGFVTTKIAGVGSLAVGISELVVPNLIPIVISPPLTPLTLIGIGMGFLAKKQAIEIMNYASSILVRKDDEP